MYAYTIYYARSTSHKHEHRVRAAYTQELDFPNYKFHEPAMVLPLPVFQAAPPKGGSIVKLNVQVQSESEVSIVISGSTWVFRHQPTP